MDRRTTPGRDSSAEAFRAWMKRRGIKSGAVAAQFLGCDKNAAYGYMRKGAPYYIGLACAAIEHDLDMPSGESDGDVGPDRELVAAE